jgi:hypothetical protein
MSDTRRHDLEEIHKSKQEAITVEKRERIERLEYKIKNESKKVNNIRENLIQAVRNNDTRAVRNFQEQIIRLGK